MPRPIITLLTDFGVKDHYVAAMKGVMLGICPEATLVDISHEIEAFNLRQAAWTLSQAWQCFPAGTVHVAVVDPGVGSERRAIAAKSGGHYFVGPDNGVLVTAFGQATAVEVHDIQNADYFRQPVSTTFHGRDIFAPVSAHLAVGLSIARLGPPISDWIPLDWAAPEQTSTGSWAGTVLSIDRFGNIVTNFEWERFGWVRGEPFEMRIGSFVITIFRESYALSPDCEYFVTKGSAGMLELSLNQRDAAVVTGAEPGAPVSLRKCSLRVLEPPLSETTPKGL